MIDARAVQRRLRAKGYIVAVDGDLGPQSYAALMAAVGLRPVGALHVALGKAAAKHLPGADIVTPLRLSHNLAQASVETAGFTRLVENLNYSADRIRAVWPSRFPTVESALAFAHNPQALAEKVYGGRFGNDRPGDGWKYRGRGTKMTTFHDNYAEVEAVTGLNVLDDPDQLSDPDKGTRAGCVYWTAKGCNAIADRDDIDALTRRINGGVTGLAERRTALARAKMILM